MALADPLVIDYGAEDPSFVVTKVLPDGRVRLNTTSDLATPETVTIRHQVSGNAAQGTLADRHLVQISRTEKDSETGKLSTASVNLTYVVPRGTTFSLADIMRLNDLLVSFMVAAPDSVFHVTRVLRGES